MTKCSKMALKNDIRDEIKVLICDKIKSKLAVEQIAHKHCKELASVDKFANCKLRR
jgi:hypothetical protein